MKKKLLSLLLSLAVALSALPAQAVLALGEGGTVTVTVENGSAFTAGEGAAWDGTLVSVSVPLEAGDTALDALTAALTEAVNGAADYALTLSYGDYISGINGLSAGDATLAGKNAEGYAWWDGWCCAVNGVMPALGMGSVYPEDGDILLVGFSLDGSLPGAAWGSVDAATDGFAVSQGVFSYTAGAFGSYAYALTLPEAGEVGFTAVPNPDGDPVRLYLNGTEAGTLGDGIAVSDGDSLQIVVGDYTAVYRVAVRTAAGVDRAALSAGIAGTLGGDVSSYWNIVGMLAADGDYTYTDAEKLAFVEAAAADIAEPVTPSATKMAMDIITLSALGYDPSALTDGGSSYNAWEIMWRELVSETEAYGGWTEVYAYGLMALLQMPEAARADWADEIAGAVSSLAAHPDGDWGYGASPDSAGIGLAALGMAERMGYPAGGTAVADAAAYLESVIAPDGAAEDIYTGKTNANTTAMVLLGLDAAGADVSAVTDGEGGAPLLPGLLQFSLADNSGFCYMAGAYNLQATQQAFLALTAAIGSGATDVFAFGAGTAVPETGDAYTGCPVVFSMSPTGAAVTVTADGASEPEAALTPGRYDLPEGTYAYTVSKSGFTSKSGSVTVTAEDADSHARRAISVSLASEPDTDEAVTVRVSVKVPEGEAGTCTYKNTPSAYSDIASATLTLPCGSTVFDALDAALTLAGLDYAEKDGYIETIDGLSEYDRGESSGWMYRVNGTTPKANSRSYALTRDSTVVWFFTDDYSAEYGSESWSSSGSQDTEVNVTVRADGNTGAAAVLSGTALTALLRAAASDDPEALITVTAPEDTTSLGLTIPGSALSALTAADGKSLAVETGFGKFVFSPEAVAALAAAAGSESAVFAITAADPAAFGEDAAALVGTRPAYVLTVTAGGETVSDFGGGSVAVSLPYTPAEGEDADAIAVFYIDGSGRIRAVRGAYDAGSGAVAFTTGHFSVYAVGYSKTVFSDVPESAWYESAVTFCAARGIALGEDDGTFAPEAPVTRAQVLAMLMRALGLEPTAGAPDNFADAGECWYTGYLAAAKALGIAGGVGDGLFAPDAPVTRQDMFTMLARALTALGELPEASSGALGAFEDAAAVCGYASEPIGALAQAGIVKGTEGRLNPLGTATRAQAVQVLYGLLSPAA